MVTKAESSYSVKLDSLKNELSKIDDKLTDFQKHTEKSFSVVESQIQLLKNKLEQNDFGDFKAFLSTCIPNIKSKLSDNINAHRGVHVPISKFGKLVDKSFVDDVSHLRTYFVNREERNGGPSKDDSNTPSRSPDELLRLVIIEHLLREDHESLAVDLMHNFNFTPNDIGLDKFRGLSDLISSIQRGDLGPAKLWLAENRTALGARSKQLEYTLAKLDFLSTMQREQVDPAAIIQCARHLVPFAAEYSADFEHLMGSLVFIGRSLEGTPYADLSLSNLSSPQCSTMDQTSDNKNDVIMTDANALSSSPNMTLQQQTSVKPDASNALSDAATLFKTCCCYQLNLSDIDPLYTAFSAGCRVLTRLHSLQRAIACLSKYSSLDGDMLPIAVQLDPVAHKHNIFHCPVIKEVVTGSNGPVRLTCGHAISRDAFNSLAIGDRSRIKCPYCPVETYKNQVLDLIF